MSTKIKKQDSDSILLKVSNLRKNFFFQGKHVKAINDVSFDIKKNETVGLIGESGSGKTTIGRTIIRLFNATSGSIEINEIDISSKKISKKDIKQLRSNIQMIFQDPYSSLNDQKNIMNIVSEPIRIHKLGKKYLHDILKNRKSIIKFYKYFIFDKFNKVYNDFQATAKEIAIETYYKIIKNLNNLTINNEIAFEDFENLFESYFRNKEITNQKILKKMNHVVNKAFSFWKQAQTRFLNNDFDEEYEVELNVIQEKYDQLKKIKKYNKKFVLLTEQIEEIIKEINYEKQILKTIKNNNFISKLLREWKDNINFSKKERYNTQFIKNYNFKTIEIFIEKSIKKFLKILKFKKIILEKNSEQVINHLFDELKTKLQKEFDEILLPKNASIVLKYNALKQKYDFTLIFNKILQDLKIKSKKIYNNRKLKNKLNELKELKIQQNKAKKEPNIKEYDKKIAKTKQKLLNTNQQFKKDLLNFTTKKEVVIKKNELKIQNQLLKLNKELKTLENEAALLFKNNVKNIFKNLNNYKYKYSKIQNLELTKKNFVVLIKHRISEYENKNSTLDLELKRTRNNLNIIIKFISGKFYFKYKLKSMMVKERVYSVLEEVGLTKSHAYRYPHEFSGGMKQRVGIARAIISNPTLLIADEPIAALDLSIQAQIVNKLNELKEKRNMSMLFIAHDLSMIRYVSNRILIIHLGRIVEHGKTEQIFTNPQHPYTINLIESMPDIAKISKGFSSTNFDAKYLQNYSVASEPYYHKIEEGHFILASKKQFQQWTKK